jgi:hypothetical protein
MTKDNDIIERMCEAAWNVHATIKWADCPEEWKPFYRDNMWAVFVMLQDRLNELAEKGDTTPGERAWETLATVRQQRIKRLLDLLADAADAIEGDSAYALLYDNINKELRNNPS